ncbi:hypothetical protein NQZ68_001249 [Dissostichus eleginoides]|nr:hypothetical protein NQZ68_001249 [Dissostichus eleginoides]
MVVCGSLLLGYQPSARTCSPPMVWIEVLLLGRLPSARDRRDPLVVLAVQLASLLFLFGFKPAEERRNRKFVVMWSMTS